MPREDFDCMVKSGVISSTSQRQTFTPLQRYVFERIGYKPDNFVGQQALFMDLQEHSPELFDCKNPIKEANLARSLHSQINMVTRCRKCSYGRKEVIGDDHKRRKVMGLRNIGLVSANEGVVPFGVSEFAQPNSKFSDGAPLPPTLMSFDPYSFMPTHPCFDKSNSWRSSFTPLDC